MVGDGDTGSETAATAATADTNADEEGGSGSGSVSGTGETGGTNETGDTNDGTCEEPCDPTLELCEDGECVCRLGLTPCAGECVDLQSDPLHCNDCQESCNMGVCDEGNCEPNCQEATDCDGACVHLDDDPLHCGDCDTPCAADELCVESQCIGYVSFDCRSDLECRGGVCCEIEDFGSVCLDGDSCP